MIDLWLILALLLLPLAAFVAWPLIRNKQGITENQRVGAADVDASDEGASAQALLYREHLAELDASRVSGAVDEAQYASLKTELGRKLLAEQGEAYRLSAARNGGRGLLVALALAVPFTAVGLYFSWGAHDDLALYRDIAASHSGESDMVVEARITQQLQERAKTHPQDLTSRYALAQRLLVSNDLPGAVAQYRYIVAREPQAANVRAELAQALFFANGSQMSPEVVSEVNQVLEIQPDNTTALGLAGIAAYDRKDYAGAKSYWQRALAQMTPGSNASQALAAGVARAERALSESGGQVAVGEASAGEPQSAAQSVAQDGKGTAGDAGNRISVKVTLPDSIQTSPDTPVFIYARTGESPMPLAIVRLKAADLPADVVLDESRAMMPGRSLKTVDEVQLVARLAIGGNARPAPGDWQGEIKKLPRAEWGKPVHIAIDHKI
ncbi:c-type cytochrome biogenesis protein CcmI [Microbulbifer hydrolyticus]|uniref:C-type cytochrome biogenesis protein CcmI n=1 Tax=Microbulbifer hydrolyticus TaxID=48074 RepID=A0A6P1TB59_9GAMM|nr:c-type cytochrome biogenesis protein CcmI [Microbulbifer hydrolyticus]MBB5210728.1 cytochrome c-type biogenesis protein CcmH [Microbulbifer hydrolyticus]QHQ38820.1 c-type cytochrome biogenesis protein CcmI [Microbulbifer hydrolyticus]